MQDFNAKATAGRLGPEHARIEIRHSFLHLISICIVMLPKLLLYLKIANGNKGKLDFSHAYQRPKPR